ncbi:MAG TPA: hypothetical protein VGF44_09510 [Terriglobales bacterium]|jgi:hypothetical protein
MKKSNLVLMAGLAVGIMFSAAPKAHAGVVVGVNVGAPVYVHPVRPYVYYAPHAYYAPRSFVAVAPVRVYRRNYAGPYYSRWYPRHEVRRGYYGWRR